MRGIEGCLPQPEGACREAALTPLRLSFAKHPVGARRSAALCMSGPSSAQLMCG